MKRNMPKMRLLLLSFCLTCGHSFTWASTPTVINQFDSDIFVQKNSTLTITETITVTTNGKMIKHGIYRDIPTDYTTTDGLAYHVTLTIAQATLDGKPTPHRKANVANGVRIYIGDKNTRLVAGKYVFTLSYIVDRELGYFKTHDELYWNVTGNGWLFPISKASASVTLPPGAATNLYGIKAYSGTIGSRDQNVHIYKTPQNIIKFETTHPLAARQGLTIIVGWPKGFVKEPGLSEKLTYFASDNLSIIISLIGLIVLWIYYLYSWRKVGKDPIIRRSVFPLFSPPDNLSPAAMRYLKKMGYDNKVFTAAILSMAVKGVLNIVQKGDEYTLTKTNKDHSNLTRPEETIANHIFKDSDAFTITQYNHKSISDTITAFKKALRREFGSIYFTLNTSYVIGGILLSALFLIPAFIFSSTDFPSLFILAFISLFFILTFTGVVAAIKNKQGLFPALLALIITVMIFIFSSFILSAASETNPYLIVTFIVVALTNLLFYYLLKRRTEIGSHLTRKIDGFKMFLAATEKDRLNFRNPPHQTPELFERYLPYALALNIEQKWSEQFNAMFSQQSVQNYQPSWYQGASITAFSPTVFSNSIGSSFSNSISSSSVAPGSSSGFSSSGSSGGGGGGGGGGGW